MGKEQDWGTELPSPYGERTGLGHRTSLPLWGKNRIGTQNFLPPLAGEGQDGGELDFAPNLLIRPQRGSAPCSARKAGDACCGRGRILRRRSRHAESGSSAPADRRS